LDTSTIVIVGANGQLGRALQAFYPGAKALDADALDITDTKKVAEYDWSGAKFILNAAAYTNVDGAETPEGRLSAWRVNAAGVANLSSIAIGYDATLVHLSTEYVFDGTQNPHREDEPLSPLSVYGSSKAAGDVAVGFVPKHYILRTSWMVGDGKNFVRTMIGLGQKGIAPKVVNDQIGRLTFANELTKAIDHLLERKAPYGIYNVSNGGDKVSWADVTRAIFKAGDFHLNVTDTTTKEYFADKPEAAKRPLLSVLDLGKLEGIGFSPRDWREELDEYVKKEITKS
jgi:dTDP-4-dehydrorhamnose 3,5-epimerase/reductase